MLLNPLFGLSEEPSSSGGPSLIGDNLSGNPFQEVLHSVQQANTAEPSLSSSGYPSLADLIADVVSAETSQNPGLERQASDHPQEGHAQGQLTASEVPIEPGLTNGLTRVTPQHQILSDIQESPLDLEPEVDPEARNPLRQLELPFLEGTTLQAGELERQNNPDSQPSHQTNTFSRLGFSAPGETLVPGWTGTGGDDSEIVLPPRGNGTDGLQILLEESDMAFSPQPEDDTGIANQASLAPTEEMENEYQESSRWTVGERPSNEPLADPQQNSLVFSDRGPGSLDDSLASLDARSHGHDQATLGHSSDPAENIRGSLGQTAVRSGERESTDQSPSGYPSQNIASWDSGSQESSGLNGRENHQAGTGSHSFQDGFSGFARAEDDSQRPSLLVGQESLTPGEDVPFEPRGSYGSQGPQNPSGSHLPDSGSSDSMLGMGREVLLQRERNLDSETAPTNGDLTTQTKPEVRAGIGIESRNTYESPEFAKDVVRILGAQQNLPRESDLDANPRVADLLKSMENGAGRLGAERQPLQTGQQTPGIGQGSTETGSFFNAETRHGEQVRTSSQASSISVKEAGSEAKAPLGMMAASSFERAQHGTDNEDSSAGEGRTTDSKVGYIRNALNRDQAQVTFTRDEHKSNLGSEQGPSLQDRSRVVSTQKAYLEQPDSDVQLLNLLPSDRQDVQVLGNTPAAPDSGFVPSIGAMRASQELIPSIDVSDQPASQPTHVDEPKVTSQIVRGARFLTREGANQVTLRLDPPELGEVTIRLSSADKSLTGEIRVESRMVQELVNRNMAGLREALGSQGIQVNNIEVSVESGGRSGVDRDGSAPSQRENADRDGQPTSDRDRQPQMHDENRERPARQAAEDGNVDFVA